MSSHTQDHSTRSDHRGPAAESRPNPDPRRDGRPRPANTDLENILACMGLPLVVVDTDLRVRRFTPQATNLFNLVQGQRGQVITTVGHSLDLPGLAEMIREVIAGGDARTSQVQGDSRIYEMRVLPYVEEDGVARGAILTFYDQTEVNHREQEFKALAENSPDIVTRFDRELRHLYVNKAVRKVTGKGPGYFMGKTNRELGMPPELCDVWDQALLKVFAEGKENLVRFEYPAARGTVHIESRMVPEFTPGGRVGSVLVVGRDITPLVNAEQMAQKTADTMAHLLASISDGFFALDNELRVTYFNSAAGRLLGRDPSQVLGRRLFEAFPEAKGSVFEQNYTQALRERRPMEFEVDFGGDPYTGWYHVRVFPFEDGISVYFRIITQQKVAEIQRAQLEAKLRHAQKMEAVGTLAGGIAHDFNNILGAIMGYAEITIEANQKGRVQTRDLESILEAARKGSALVRQILAFSRKSTSTPVPIDVNREVHQAVEILSRTISKMVEIKPELTAENAVIMGDGSQIQQVLMNLASNAQDAMPAGGVLIIGTEVAMVDRNLAPGSLEPGPHLRLSVRDTGQGIDRELVDKVFDPFFTTKEVGRGTGLGLAMVYGIVKDHGGHITCQSEPGKGTRFDIYFPLVDGQGPVDTRRNDPEQNPAGGDETILVADDEAHLRDVARKILSARGYRVHTAASAEEALRVLRDRKGRVDLVILDIGMPGMGGHLGMEKILEIKPEAKVIIATGYAKDDKLEGTLKSGAAGYVAKPYGKADLLTAVRNVLDALPS